MLRHIIVLFCCSCVTSDLLNLDEGSKCMRNGVSGVCVKTYRCLSKYLDFMNKDYAPICSFQGKEPIICCTDCELENDTRKFIMNPRLGILNITGHKAHDKCIEYMHKLNYPCKTLIRTDMKRVHIPESNCNKIDLVWIRVFAAVGGNNAQREEFPHMALLGFGDDVRAADWLCGGSVISERFVLTASHCLSSPALGQVKFIALGILKRSDPIDLWQIYNVRRIIAHPDYRPPSKYHDIALLETDKPIAFNDQVRPACLHTQGEADEYAVATGWGTLGHREKLADNLQSVNLNRFEENDCMKTYPPHRHLKSGYNHTTQMCYGNKLEQKDTCEGDSGGPLQSTFHYKYNCVFTILGVTSYGRPCGVSDASGIYTRVFHYVPWIESVVWP